MFFFKLNPFSFQRKRRYQL